MQQIHVQHTPNQSDCQVGSYYFDLDGKQWLFWWRLVRLTSGWESFIYRPTITLKNVYCSSDCICDIIRHIPSYVTLAFMQWLYTDAENMQRDQVSHGRGKCPTPPPPFVAITYASIFLSQRDGNQWCQKGGGCSVDTGVRGLACAPSLNSPRSNLQTAAEFWQILLQCLLPLGDTFFIYFSSPLLWYSLHGALAPQAIVSSVLLPCLKNQMDLQGLPSTPPFFWTYECDTGFYFHSFISTLSKYYKDLELAILLSMRHCCCGTAFTLFKHDFLMTSSCVDLCSKLNIVRWVQQSWQFQSVLLSLRERWRTHCSMTLSYQEKLENEMP